MSRQVAMALPAFLERARLAKHQASLDEAGFADSRDLAEATNEELAECGLKKPELIRLRRTLTELSSPSPSAGPPEPVETTIFSDQPHPRPRAASPLNEPGEWDFFISHTRRNADAMLLAAELKTELKERGYTVWLDVNEANKTTPAMVEGATHSRCCLAILTGPCKNIDHPEDPEEDNAFLNRWFCAGSNSLLMQ